MLTGDMGAYLAVVFAVNSQLSPLSRATGSFYPAVQPVQPPNSALTFSPTGDISPAPRYVPIRFRLAGRLYGECHDVSRLWRQGGVHGTLLLRVPGTAPDAARQKAG